MSDEPVLDTDGQPLADYSRARYVFQGIGFQVLDENGEFDAEASAAAVDAYRQSLSS